jgi:metal-responsive CopG/Arc/MetJ family transcriptional regulator
MKTIAISIDEASLAAVDRIARTAGRRRGGKREANRSEVIRRAVREFLAHQKRHEREESDRLVLAANRERIEREARSLVTAQADL